MNELAIFAGAGGGILAGNLLGWRTVCAVERDAYAAQVLAQRQNDGLLRPFPIWSDVCSFDGSPWKGIVDIVSGGFPCQAYSTASHGNRVADDLWPEMQRIITDVSPRYVFAENVSKEAINAACYDLRTMGYKTKSIAISAKDMGADHIRERYWLLAYANDKSKLLSKINAEMAISKKFHKGIWSAYPEKSRMDDGLAYRMDRFKAIGNGQVPAVAIAALFYLCNDD